jgi:hypothetical protein
MSGLPWDFVLNRCHGCRESRIQRSTRRGHLKWNRHEPSTSSTVRAFSVKTFDSLSVDRFGWLDDGGARICD